MSIGTPSVQDISPDELKTALVGLRSRILDFADVHGAVEVLAGSDSMLAALGIQRLAGAEIRIEDGVELVDPQGFHDDVLIKGSVVYLTVPRTSAIDLT